MDQKILNKIKKCLAMANSQNANEAATALRQAQKLMEAHNVSAEDLELSEISRHDVRGSTANTPPRWFVALVSIIAEAFGCEPVLSGRGDGGCNVVFIGAGAQPEICGYAFEVLHRQLKRDRTNHIKQQNKRLLAKTKTARGDLFAMAWVHEVHQHILPMTVSERTSALIESFKERAFPSRFTSNVVGRKRKASQRDRASALAGRIAGKKAQLNAGIGPGQQHARLEG